MNMVYLTYLGALIPDNINLLKYILQRQPIKCINIIGCFIHFSFLGVNMSKHEAVYFISDNRVIN